MRKAIRKFFEVLASANAMFVAFAMLVVFASLLRQNGGQPWMFLAWLFGVLLALSFLARVVFMVVGAFEDGDAGEKVAVTIFVALLIALIVVVMAIIGPLRDSPFN